MDQIPTPKYMSTPKTTKFFGISRDTLLRWGKANIITFYNTRPDGQGHMRWDINSFRGVIHKADKNIIPKPMFEKAEETKSEKRGICYCRVLTRNHMDELKTQIDLIQEKYPNFEVIKDFGSGTNFKRRGFMKILDQAVKGDISTIVITHKDVLTRIGFELFEWLFQKLNISLVVLNQNTESEKYELYKDLMSIVRNFSVKAGGKYKKQNIEYESSKTEEYEKPEDDEAEEVVSEKEEIEADA